MSDVFKSITHGTCALGGRHTSERWARGCQALGSVSEPTSVTENPDQGVGSGSPEERPVSRLRGRVIHRIFRDGAPNTRTIQQQGRAARPGRPRVPVAEQRQKARERARAYRARRAS
jgi:hypothetical protein